jgi:hypothetical protein
MHRLIMKDKALVQQVVNEKFTDDGSHKSIWDFADSLENEILKASGAPGPSRLTLHDRKKALQEQVQRFSRLEDAKQAKLAAVSKQMEEAEIRECTFQPSTLRNPAYGDVKSRYLNSRFSRKGEASYTPEPPSEQVLTTVVKTNRTEEFMVELSADVLKRIDEGERFFDTYREHMHQLREFYSNLVKQEAAAKLAATN